MIFKLPVILYSTKNDQKKYSLLYSFILLCNPYLILLNKMSFWPVKSLKCNQMCILTLQLIISFETHFIKCESKTGMLVYQRHYFHEKYISIKNMVYRLIHV